MGFMRLCVILSIFFSISLSKSRYDYGPGYHRIWNDPKYINVSPEYGTTATICVDVHEDIGIHLLAENGKLLHEIYPRDDAFEPADMCYTFCWKDDGMTIFKNGVYAKYVFDENLLNTNEVFVNASGTISMNVMENQPVWALSSKSVWDTSVFPIPLDTPVNLNMKRKLRVGDYIVIVAKKKPKTVMKIEMVGIKSKFIPLSFKLKTDESKHDVIMSSYLENKLHTEHNFTDTFNYNFLSDDVTYTLTFVCEQFGWRVFLNAKDMFFYYHQLPFNEVNNIKLSGENGQWSLVRLVR